MPKDHVVSPKAPVKAAAPRKVRVAKDKGLLYMNKKDSRLLASANLLYWKVVSEAAKALKGLGEPTSL
jgi:hypothetical protein